MRKLSATGSARLVENVERVLESVPRQDRIDFFEQFLPEGIQDRFFAELADKCSEQRENVRLADPDPVEWHRRPRVGRLWDKPKYSRRPSLRVIPGEGGVAPPSREGAGDVLRELEPRLYIETLTGVQVPSERLIACPLPGHDDRTPSMRVYPDASRGFYCFGCHAGGDIYNFASALWGLDSRREFPELRRRIAESLLGRVAA
jgi:hypothetical protein